MIAVSALGAVRARIHGVDVDLGGPRQRAVLGMLVAARGRVVSIDRFVEQLWTGEPPPKAVGALHAYVSHLRRTTEPDRSPRQPASVIVSSSPGYRLALPTAAVDVWRFAALVDEAGRRRPAAEVVALVEEAMQLWTDEPYGGYGDAAWARPEVERLTGLRSLAVELRAAARLELGESASLLAELAEHSRAHPLREEAARLLALAQYRAGRQDESLATLAGARRALADELGVDPSPALRDLETDVLRHAVPAAGAAGVTRYALQDADAPTTAGEAGPPPTDRGEVTDPAAGDFVGRVAELERLRAAADRVVDGPAVVWLEGEPGAGKSALLSEFVARLAVASAPAGADPPAAAVPPASGGAWRVVRGQVSEVDGAPPGWPWLEVLIQLGQDPATVGAGVHSLATAVGTALPPWCVVALEDVHRADEGTLQVLRHLVSTTARPVLFLSTFRSHEPTPDLTNTLSATAGRTVDRIRLGALDDRAAASLVHRAVGRPLPDAVTTALVDRAGGNPLFLRQLGQLVAAEGVADAERSLPTAIGDVLHRRVARLPDAVVDTLSRAAVLGRSVEFEVLLACETARGTSTEEQLVDALDAGVLAGLLEAPDADSVRFTHALVRDALYARLPPLRRSRLHQVALDVLERLRPGELAAVAHHATAGLDRRTAARALRHLRAAAAQALAMSALTDAVGHLRAALQAAELAGVDLRERLALHRDLVSALAASGDVVAARTHRAVSLAAARAVGTAHDVAAAWVLDAPGLLPTRPTTEDNRAVLTELQEVLRALGTDDLPLRVRLLVTLVREADPFLLALVGDAADEALAVAESLDDPALVCQALNAQYFSPRCNADTGWQETIGRRMLRTAQTAGLLAYQALAHVVLHAVWVGRGDIDRAGQHIAAAVTAGAAGQLSSLLSAASVFDGTTAVLQDDVPRARRAYATLLGELARLGDPNGRVIEVFCTFAVDHAHGSTAARLPDLVAVARDRPGEVDGLLVSSLLDAGREQEARQRWRPEPWPDDPTWLFSTAVMAETAARLGDRATCAWTAAALAPWTGELVRTRNGGLLLGPVDYFLGVAAVVDERPDDAAAHLERASRLVRDLGPDSWRSRIQAARRQLDGPAPRR